MIVLLTEEPSMEEYLEIIVAQFHSRGGLVGSVLSGKKRPRTVNSQKNEGIELWMSELYYLEGQ